MVTMTALDYGIFAIIVISMVLGWWRGFIYELLTLLGWVAAYFVARLFADEAARLLPQAVTWDIARSAIAYVVLFILSLLVGGLLARLLSKLVKFVGMGWMDGFLGGLFGLLRGGLLVLILVLLAGLTELPHTPLWRNAVTRKPLQIAALYAKGFLPENVAKMVHY